MITSTRSGRKQSLKLSRRSNLLSSLSMIAWMIVCSAILCQAEDKCSCHQLVWKDHDFQIFRVVIAPHTSSSAFWHTDDYTFIPLSDEETLESVRQGETRSPFRNAKDYSNSWVARDSKIRFVHPHQT